MAKENKLEENHHESNHWKGKIWAINENDEDDAYKKILFDKYF